jgi:hypothetical protein
MLFDRVKQAVGFGVEAARVQGEDAVGPAGQVGVLDQGDVFRAGEGDGDVGPESGEGLGVFFFFFFW